VARSPHTASAAFSQGGENAPATHPKKPSRSWRVIIIRSKGEYLRSVEAPDRERPAPDPGAALAQLRSAAPSI
jgi:hypothetical protein